MTCIRFDPYTDSSKQRIFFKNNESGCWAKLGYLGEYWAKRGVLNQVRFTMRVAAITEHTFFLSLIGLGFRVFPKPLDESHAES